MMHMTFYWGKNVTLLVDSWQTTSWTSYSLTLLACFIISVFYQYLEDRRVRFKLISSAKAGNPTSQIDAPLLQGGAGKASGSKLVCPEARRSSAVRVQFGDRVLADACGDVV
uniref:Copper transport protein n=1 Tax=Fagus sylvatica TaxID=28930 RepID=A0A2N9ESJ4_FAGSY